MGGSAPPRHTVPAIVRRVRWHAPLGWLVLGWRDLERAPRVSLAYGAVFVALGYLAVAGLAAAGLGHLWPALMAGLFAAGPVLAAGLCEVSRRLERSCPPASTRRAPPGAPMPARSVGWDWC